MVIANGRVPARRDPLFENSNKHPHPTRQNCVHGCHCWLAQQCSAGSTLWIAHFIHRPCTQWTELAPFVTPRNRPDREITRVPLIGVDKQPSTTAPTAVERRAVDSKQQFRPTNRFSRNHDKMTKLALFIFLSSMFLPCPMWTGPSERASQASLNNA